ncbi:MAG: site-2 protease family protein [Tissierella sp.]|uniref:site-2 protease family protein n=1 Tax=Tissierella sp. TaxID=41274 RepID=UPI003F9E0E3D
MGDLKKESKKKGKSKIKGKYLWFVLFVILSGVLGFLMGYLKSGILEEFFERYINNDMWYMEMLNMALMVLIFIVGFIIHIILHEGGHLVFGFISGYEFVSFRVGSFVIIKEKGEFKSKRYSIPGTAGQCLMMPPEKKNENFPFILYNLGGALFNIIVSAITIVIAMSLKELSWIKVILILTSGAGLIAAITNGIPLKIGGMTNDGHNIMTMARDKDSRDSFYLQLRVNGLLTSGIRIKDMNYDDFILKEDIDYKNPLNFSRIFINHNYHLDKCDFKSAKEALEFGRRYVNSTIAIYRMEWLSEVLFLELIGDCDSQRIEELYDESLKKYIEASKFMLNKKRIMMAYELLYQENKQKALKYLEELKDLAKRYPVKGEVDMELMLGKFLQGKM